jgi:hypothetical protein
MANRIATGIASFIGITIVAAGTAIYTHSTHLAELRVKCDQTRGEIFELHDKLAQYPSAADLLRCRERVELLERYRDLDEHRVEKIEKLLDELTSKPKVRPDKFSGTDGREMEDRLDKRLKALEGKL